MIELRAVSAGYQTRPEVLTDATVAIPNAVRVAVLGANGSGKTTLLKLLSGAHRPASGSVLLDGSPLDYSRKGLGVHRRQVQLVLQDPQDQLFSADVSQDVAFGPLNLGMSEAEAMQRVDETLALLGISHLAGRPCHQLSFGEAKRVAIAGAVAMRPSILLLDEPTAGLDPRGVDEMRSALDQLSALGTAVVIATHEVDFALSWADQAAVVADGQITSGDVAELLSDEALLARAHLRQPWQLALAGRLGISPAPRDVDAMAAAIQGINALLTTRSPDGTEPIR